MENTFLTAEWRKLAMANYVVDPAILQPFVPSFTELDSWNEKCYLSLVAFLFQDTRVKGCSIPFHRNFEEINLRFYVRYRQHGEWKRGVVFISEFVPLRMVTLVANSLYQEHYRTVPTLHQQLITPEALKMSYKWRLGEWHSFTVNAKNSPQPMIAGSEEEFITQHFWGYSKKTGYTSEYQVQHERWLVYPVTDFHLDLDFGVCYGDHFAFLNRQAPASVFLAEGSPVTVFKDVRLFA